MAQNPVGVANIMVDRVDQSDEDLAFMDQAVLMVSLPSSPSHPKLGIHPELPSPPAHD